jgi:hypothetical protein
VRSRRRRPRDHRRLARLSFGYRAAIGCKSGNARPWPASFARGRRRLASGTPLGHMDVRRRRGRVAEGGGLLNRYTLSRRIEGSNPSVSASLFVSLGSAHTPPSALSRLLRHDACSYACFDGRRRKPPRDVTALQDAAVAPQASAPSLSIGWLDRPETGECNNSTGKRYPHGLFLPAFRPSDTRSIPRLDPSVIRSRDPFRAQFRRPRSNAAVAAASDLRSTRRL